MAAVPHEEGQPATYSIAGVVYDAASPGFVDAIARAHASQRRPRCMCMPGGIEVYVAKLNGSYVVKRMPETGEQHAAICLHFEPAIDTSGLGALIGTAIREDPATGLTSLKLDFSLSRVPRSPASSPTSVSAAPTAHSCPRLSLRGLLLYLWEQAGLTRWQPGFAGKRPWVTVRRRLIEAARDKLIGGRPLLQRLFVPEPFSVEQRDSLDRRRAAFWSMTASGSIASAQLFLLIGELKEIAPARCGFRAVVRHMPDQGFVLDERLYIRVTRRLHQALALWNAADNIRMLMIATIGVAASGVPSILELALVPTTREWLPVENAFDLQLIERLVANNRSFLKSVQLDPRPRRLIPCATLIDCTKSTPQLFVVTNTDHPRTADMATGFASGDGWAWYVADGPMPDFPDDGH